MAPEVDARQPPAICDTEPFQVPKLDAVVDVEDKVADLLDTSYSLDGEAIDHVEALD